MKPVAILGSGPAGLLAAHAIGITGYPIAVFSLEQKSVIGGAQFLHQAIPQLTDETPDATVTFNVVGDALTYAQKVYGFSPPSVVSFHNVYDGMEQPAWQMQRHYDYLWEQFGNSLNVQQVTPDWLQKVSVDHEDFRMILSTVPLPAICQNPNHAFAAQEVWIADHCVLNNLPDNTVIYDGTPHRGWYRASRLFGTGGTEYSAASLSSRPPVQTRQFRKPIRTTCDCWPNVVRLGRFGEWKKGVLAHDAFVKALKVTHEAGIWS